MYIRSESIKKDAERLVTNSTVVAIVKFIPINGVEGGGIEWKISDKSALIGLLSSIIVIRVLCYTSELLRDLAATSAENSEAPKLILSQVSQTAFERVPDRSSLYFVWSFLEFAGNYIFPLILAVFLVVFTSRDIVKFYAAVVTGMEVQHGKASTS